MSTASATNNKEFLAEIDADADSVLVLNFDVAPFENWKYEVRNKKESAILWQTDSTAAGKIAVDVAAKTLTIEWPKDTLKEGKFYHKLYADTADASDKLRLGGDRALTVKNF